MKTVLRAVCTRTRVTAKVAVEPKRACDMASSGLADTGRHMRQWRCSSVVRERRSLEPFSCPGWSATAAVDRSEAGVVPARHGEAWPARRPRRAMAGRADDGERTSPAVVHDDEAAG